MRLVKRHIIQKNYRFYAEIYPLYFLYKNLYNCANYLIRKSGVLEKTYRHYYDLQNILQSQP